MDLLLELLIDMEELVSKNYTLQKHLKKLSEIDKEYELLYSIWDLNKRNLSNGLNTISSYFPNYSLHDISHSMTVIDNIQRFLGESRIKNLSATDTFLLLMSGLTHDIGMILTYRILEKEWSNTEIIDKIYSLTTNEDKVISDAANKIIKLHKRINEKEKENENEEDVNDKQEDNYKWAIEIKDAVIILTAELFRKKHASLSAENLTTNREFQELANNFYSEQLPKRFIELLSKIALLHGKDFDNILSMLHKEADGYRGDNCHPRFIASMIRLGDYLDFDSNRFDPFSIATLKEMPETSVLHQQKHASVKHMLISPSSIEAELDCPNERVYRVARSWFDGLEKEVDSQRREWTHIAPDDLGGYPPIINKDGIKIIYKGYKASPDLLNLKFTMSQEKIFSILKGGGIYKEPGFAFIREIVQNALDASKIQMWNDITTGRYGNLIKPLKDILFPDDIKDEIYDLYPIHLSVKWKEGSNQQILRIECSDKGTGISEKNLLRMTQNVGDSHYKDFAYNDFYKSMPFWIKPTAAFGIGLQSIFFVTQSFEVETNYPGESTKRIIFRSSANNQYCSIVEENIDRLRGTTVRVDIHKNRFEEIFGNTFSWSILDLDYINFFNEKTINPYIAKIDVFVSNSFSNKGKFPFTYESESTGNATSNDRELKNNNTHVDANTKSTNSPEIIGNYRYTHSYNNGILEFVIDERQYGSSFSFYFSNIYGHNRLSQKIYLRDVLISNVHLNYNQTSYLGFIWNLNNQSSDQIVDISRDNITSNGYKWIYESFISKLLPDYLELIGDTFIHYLEKDTKNTEEHAKLEIQYINYCFSLMANGMEGYKMSVLEKIIIPQRIASYNDEDLQASRFLSSNTLLIVNGCNTSNGEIVQQDIEEIKRTYKDILSDNIIIWNENDLFSALYKKYLCVEIVVFNSKYQIYKLIKKSKETGIGYLTCKENGTNYLHRLSSGSVFNCTRIAIYGLERYPNIIVKKEFLSGFERFPSYCNCCIYSPFEKQSQVNTLMSSTNGMGDEELMTYLRKNISDYITPRVIQIIQEKNIKKGIKEDLIKEDYCRLLFDFIKIERRIFQESLQ